MRNERSPRDNLRYARAAEVAARQWGNITGAQLRALGFSKTAIHWMREHGLLHRRHRGVFAFGAPSAAPEATWAAALLAAGRGSALAGTSAAAAFGQLPVREVTEVVAPTRRRGDATLRVRAARRFDVGRHRGLRVTSPAQTLLDLAAASWPIDRMTHELAAAGLVRIDDLRTFARDRRGEPGARAMAIALDLPHTRSGWEREFLRWIRGLEGLPAPRMNDRIGRLTVDVHWPEHGTAWARRNDAARDEALRARGKEAWRVTAQGPALAARLRQRLA